MKPVGLAKYARQKSSKRKSVRKEINRANARLTLQDKKASGNVPTQERLAYESERCLM
jgi:hypothetical protein